jgi:hypothetical protein
MSATPQPALIHIQERIMEMTAILHQLLNAPLHRFDERLHSRIPNKQGIYAIYRLDGAGPVVIRAGRTKTASGGLLQRIYRNQYQGQQDGNLRAQLTNSGICSDRTIAKLWMKRNAAVRFLVIENNTTRMWAEYFMLSILQPVYCD